MNRKIKFRGISIDEWVYGMLCKVNEDDTEHGEYEQYFITDETTIGQFTRFT